MHQHKLGKRNGHFKEKNLPELKVRDAIPEPQRDVEDQPRPETRPPVRSNQVARPPPPNNPPTIVSLVYVTASKTFDGPARYVTPNIVAGPPLEFTGEAPRPTPATQNEESPRPPRNLTPPDERETEREEPRVESPRPRVEEEPAATPDPRGDDPSREEDRREEPLATPEARPSSNFPSPSASFQPVAVTGTTEVTDAAVVDESSSGDNISVGTGAGIALGSLAMLGIILGLVLLFYRRRKKQRGAMEKLEDEKSNFGSETKSAAFTRGSSLRTKPAPRLSLRPVTTFGPNLTGTNNLTNDGSVERDNRTGVETARLTPSPASDGQPRLGTASSNNPANPFGKFAEPAERHQKTVANDLSAPSPVGTNHPIKTDSLSLISGVIPGHLPTVQTPVHPVAGRDIGCKGPPTPLAIKGAGTAPPAMASPAMTDFTDISTLSRAPGDANGVRLNNVYRVQLDFKPSMDDELELSAGQLVRVGHEFDDGWALCTRMDHSQQGVVPRTCLSKNPVKPRTNGPAPPKGAPRSSPQGPGAHGPNQFSNGPPRHPDSPGMRGPNTAAFRGPNGPPNKGMQGPNGPPPALRGPPNGPQDPLPRPPINGSSPRPNGPLPTPAARFPQPPRAFSPAHGGRMSPGPFSANAVPRPLSPAMHGAPRPMAPAGAPYAQHPRSMSPGPYGAGYQRPTNPAQRRRSNSASQVMVQRPMPPGPSKMNPNGLAPRKPVPGQAL